MIETAEEFVKLRTSDNPAEYQRAATEEASEETWLKVIADYPDMREWVAHNKSIPESIIRTLFELGDPKMKTVLSRKRSTPSDILDLLAVDEDESVRLQIARHPKVSQATLELLKGDSWEEVRRIASLR